MENVLNILQVILGILLIIAILLQAKGDGLGTAIGGGSGSIISTRRGPERGLFLSTVVLATLFLVVAALHLFV